MSDSSDAVRLRLNTLLAEAGQPPLDSALAQCFDDYLSLILRWNARINLTAVRDEDGILSRHFIESIVCARSLPTGIGTLLDFGSGAGFPGIPIALCRPEIAVTLSESQGKKAAFLQEAVRVLDLSAKVYSGRSETLAVQFDCVALRAVDKIHQAVQAAARLAHPGGWLVLMTTESELEGLKSGVGPEFTWSKPVPLPRSDDRVLVLGVHSSGPNTR
jgi:16S rRNA (guanine527-N7)-methyltransferase